jgi:hypothetical protein
MKDKRIPTILGTILLLVLLTFGVWLSMQKTNTVSKASGECSPIGLQITNLTDKSADISFFTSALCSTSLIIDGKTVSNYKSKLSIHYFRIDNLLANTQYQYYIISDGQEYKQADFTFKTATKPTSQISPSNLAWGKIIDSANNPSPDTIVYINIAGAWPLSALTDANGQWHISLSNSFTEDKSAPFVPPLTGSEDILVYTSQGQLTQVENDLSKNDPVPDIVIGQGFITELDTGSDPEIIIPINTVIVPTTGSVGIGGLLSIKSPAEGESITALKPDIFGSGKSNSTVNLSIDTEIVGQTTTKNDGVWHWSPDKNLSLGSHILTVTLGTELLQRNFIVVSPSSSSSALSFTATPSATIVPTTIPTIIPTNIPTVRSSKPASSTKIPVTGNSYPLYLLLLSSLFTITFSLYFFNKDEK